MKTKICITLFLRSFFSRRARRFLSKSAALITFSVVAFIPAVMRGNTVALAFTGGSEENIRGAITVGWPFSLSTRTLVTDVGLWDFQGDGLGQAHDVTIWTSTGTQLIQMTIPS